MGLVILLSCLSIAAVSAQEGKTSCSIPSAEPFTEVVLTCYFPEDLGVSKKDFTIYHYVKNGTAESVVDCWWIKGKLDCYTQHLFEYNRTINTQLAVTISNVTDLHTGSYSCQVAGYGPHLLETCLFQLENRKVNKCEVRKKKSEPNATLACHFSEDIARKQLNFSVHKHICRHLKEVINCWWEDGKTRCKAESGDMNISTVSSNFAFLIKKVTNETAGNYSCWHSGSQALDHKTCSLDEHSDGLEEPPENNVIDPYVIILGLLLLIVLVVVILLLIFRRKLFSRFCHKRRRQTSHDETKEAENVKMLEKKDLQTLKFQEYLEQTVKEMFPDIFNACYFVPPIYFNKSRYKKETVATTSCLVYESSEAIDVEYDQAMQHVLHSLRHMGEQRNEQMFVLTQFQYEDYLNTVSQDYARHSVPRVQKEDVKNIKCFDLLIIHRKLGFIAAVVKTVGGSSVKEKSDQQTTDEIIMAQCNEATSQLKNAGNIIQHLMSDQRKCPEVRLLLILPNLLSSSHVPDVTSQDDQVQLMFADDLPDSKSNSDVTTKKLQKLSQWWDRLKESTGEDAIMTDELYMKAVSRFCGPATQSHLKSEDGLLLPKTLAEAVLVTGKLYERQYLHPNMNDLLEEEKLILVGPPNTGKTRMLTLAAERWRASELHVISGKRAEHNFVMQQPCAHNIRCNFNDRKQVEETLRSLCEKNENENEHKTLCVLAFNVSGQYFKQFCSLLKKKHPDICMWATARTMKEIPKGWSVRTLTHALNCPPAVVRAASGADYNIPGADNEELVYLPPTDGPPVKYFSHKKDQSNQSHDCAECGKEVAEFIKLLITSRGNSASTSPDRVSVGARPVSTENVSSKLQDKDLLVLFECDLKQGENFLNELNNAGISVHTLRDEEDRNDFTKENESAIAMHINELDRRRLRRKLVVYVESKSWKGDMNLKWRGITSCTSQLIVVSKNIG